MRIFGGDSIDGMLRKLGLKQNESIDHPWINKALERAQQKVEARNFDIRNCDRFLRIRIVMPLQKEIYSNIRCSLTQNWISRRHTVLSA